MRDLLILLACAACLALALLAALATAPPTRRRLIAWCAGCGRPLCEGDGLHAIGTQRWGKCCRDKFFAEARAIGDPPGSRRVDFSAACTLPTPGEVGQTDGREWRFYERRFSR